jgi:polysaccharide export outer membrane protein
MKYNQVTTYISGLLNLSEKRNNRQARNCEFNSYNPLMIQMHQFIKLAILMLIIVSTASRYLEGAEIDTKLDVSSAMPKDYALYPGDLLKIEVFDNIDLATSIRVPAEGKITFPLIGEVKNLVGKSIAQFTSEIAQRLEHGYLRQAVVTATVTEFGPRSVYVMGSISRPSNIQLSPFGDLTAMQAIGQAGGFLEDANRAGAQVIRDDPSNLGRKIGLPVPGSDHAESLVTDVVLHPNDIIIVPRLDRVYIIGQVAHPGAVNLPSQEVLTVSKAVSLAGGFSQFAKQSEVQLMRAGKRVLVVDVRSILNGDIKSEDPILQPGDTVYVPESRF